MNCIWPLLLLLLWLNWIGPICEDGLEIILYQVTMPSNCSATRVFLSLISLRFLFVVTCLIVAESQFSLRPAKTWPVILADFPSRRGDSQGQALCRWTGTVGWTQLHPGLPVRRHKHQDRTCNPWSLQGRCLWEHWRSRTHTDTPFGISLQMMGTGNTLGDLT